MSYEMQIVVCTLLIVALGYCLIRLKNAIVAEWGSD